MPRQPSSSELHVVTGAFGYTGGAIARVLGMAMRDVTLTREEYAGLSTELLVVGGAPAGRTRFSDWLRANADGIGAHYASEMARRRRPRRRLRSKPAPMER